MKRPLIAFALPIAMMLAAAAAPLPALAHSDVSVRVNLGWPAVAYPAAVYYDTWRPAPQRVYYDDYRPVVVYREYERHGGHHRGHGRGHYVHDHDRYCRH
ncbi:MAG: hypothetical protein WC809_13690 [Sinimarinibacterium sp.]|jgi:hypothetical protein